MEDGNPADSDDNKKLPKTIMRWIAVQFYILSKRIKRQYKKIITLSVIGLLLSVLGFGFDRYESSVTTSENKKNLQEIVENRKISQENYDRLLSQLETLKVNKDSQRRLLNNLLDQIDVKDQNIYVLETQLEDYKKRIEELLQNENISEGIKALVQEGRIDEAEELVDRHYEENLKSQEEKLAQSLYERGEIKKLNLKRCIFKAPCK